MKMADSDIALIQRVPYSPPSVLPAEIIATIMGHLEPEDVTRAALVNRTWAEAARSDTVWTRLENQLPNLSVRPPSALQLPPLQPRSPRSFWKSAGCSGLIGVSTGFATQLTVFLVLLHRIGYPQDDRALDSCVNAYCESISDPTPACLSYYKGWVTQQLSPLPSLLAKCGNQSLATQLCTVGAGTSVLGAIVGGILAGFLHARVRKVVRWYRGGQAQPDADAEIPAPPESHKRAVMRKIKQFDQLSAEFGAAVMAGGVAVVEDWVQFLGPCAPKFINLNCDSDKASPFLMSARKNDAPMFRLLLHNGGDLSVRDDAGESVENVARRSAILSDIIDAFAPSVHIAMPDW